MKFTLTEQNYRDLFDSANDAMWVQDMDGSFMVVNRALERLVGINRDELLGKNVRDFLSGDSLNLAREVGRRLLLGEDFDQPYEQRFFTKDGRVRTIKISTSLVVIDGRPVGFQHVARDVTEEKSMSEMLAEITNGSPIPTFVIDKQHRITHWNTALESLTGLRSNQMLGTDAQWQAFYLQKRPTLADMIVDGASNSDIEDAYGGKSKKSTLIDGAYEAEDFRSAVRGVGRWLRFTASPIKSDSDETVGAIETLQDVTDEKNLQENMRYYVQLITRAQEEERKRLARDLHDELSSSLLLLIQRLDTTMPKGKANQLSDLKEKLDTARAEAVEALQQVRRYVQDLRPRILDDLGLTASLEWMAEDMQRNRGIQTSVDVDDVSVPLPPDVQLLLFRIAQEALSNIRRHAQATAAAITLAYDGDHIVMTVSDNGHGFDVPPRIEDLASAGRLGIMGMAERAKLLNGTLEVVSSPGKGTRVVTRLPLPREKPEIRTSKRQTNSSRVPTKRS